ncbi:facilitated trehalose transporter Tret1-like [Pararge aegeria]|uniref:Jg25448 protein n=3 Tax=Pararge aegeria TaxID=116150 RepID=A0A8S4SFZ6_9NEOP|nr:facilitated trehalose transporter Tret1-like [Pararge aegeria]CAH2261871.1 jg25448 [Pararge aegeria aegeria]
MVTKVEIGSPDPTVSRLRSITSQFIASSSSFLLLLDLGMAINFSTIMMPALLNATEGLSLTETQASWFGSMSFLTQPAGALISGPIVDYLGRRKANFISNIPVIVAWLLMYFSWNIPSLFAGSALLGISLGIMEAPINSYVGEISDPSIRGALCTVTQFFVSVGILIMFFLGTIVDWRSAALICLIAPIASMLMVTFAPETPVWLLTRNREKEALQSLCKLRGWTTPDNVKAEFDELHTYSKNMPKCVICCNNNQEQSTCEHESMNWFVRRTLTFRYVMLCKETLRPLALVMMYFLFYVMSGLVPIRPNLINLCGALGMAQDGKNIAFMVGVITFITTFIVIGLIKLVGKRKLSIASLLGSAISCLLLSIYARRNLDDTVFSYKPSTFPTETSVVPIILLYMLTIFTGLGIPWVLLGELFPFRSRASAQGLSAASNYVFSFIGTKTFIDLETNFMLWGTFAVYATFGFIGAAYLYFFLPETEGKSLVEIEEFYKGELRIFADDPIINCVRRHKR